MNITITLSYLNSDDPDSDAVRDLTSLAKKIATDGLPARHGTLRDAGGRIVGTIEVE